MPSYSVAQHSTSQNRTVPYSAIGTPQCSVGQRYAMCTVHCAVPNGAPQRDRRRVESTQWSLYSRCRSDFSYWLMCAVGLPGLTLFNIGTWSRQGSKQQRLLLNSSRLPCYCANVNSVFRVWWRCIKWWKTRLLMQNNGAVKQDEFISSDTNTTLIQKCSLSACFRRCRVCDSSAKQPSLIEPAGVFCAARYLS